MLVIAYGDPHQIDFLAFLVGAAQSVRPDFDGPHMQTRRRYRSSSAIRAVRPRTGEGRVEGRHCRDDHRSTAFKSGAELWDWIVWSNPIVEEVLGTLGLSEGERAVIRQSSITWSANGRARVARLFWQTLSHIGIGTR